MKKVKRYRGVRLVADAIRELENQFVALSEQGEQGESLLTVQLARDEDWSFDNFDEFVVEYPNAEHAYYYRRSRDMSFEVTIHENYTSVSARARARETIQKFFNIVEKFREASTLPPQPQPEKEPPRPIVFIGHGRSQQWRDLKDHLHEKHGYEVQAYEIGARAGHTIRDILEEMLEVSSFALLVLTAEDETADHRYLARQNVVHEAGLFQGRIGFARAIILLEEGTEQFSNIAGIEQIRYSKGNIKETFGEVLAVLKREFGD